MKKNFLMMAFVCLFAVVALNSCSKDDDDNNSSSISNVLTVAVENGNNYNEEIDAVTLEIDYNILAESDYANGGFTITLPESVSSEYIRSLGNIPDGVKVSTQSLLTPDFQN